jgi:sortase A
VIGALALFIHNKVQSDNAARFAEEVVYALQTSDYTPPSGDDDIAMDEHTVGETSTAAEEVPQSVTIRDYDFIGYLSIPSLWLDLPVMSGWSYDNLNVSPCRYSGSPQTDDFVIAAHNYSSHFGFIQTLEKGDTVCFTDIHAKQYNYRVELIDTLSPTDVDDMTSGEYDLTLFTCTYSGKARVTVRLNRTE